MGAQQGRVARGSLCLRDGWLCGFVFPSKMLLEKFYGYLHSDVTSARRSFLSLRTKWSAFSSLWETSVANGCPINICEVLHSEQHRTCPRPPNLSLSHLAHRIAGACQVQSLSGCGHGCWRLLASPVSPLGTLSGRVGIPWPRTQGFFLA